METNSMSETNQYKVGLGGLNLPSANQDWKKQQEDQELNRLRDKFAMSALTGMLANPGRFDATQSLVDYAFQLANDCMHEREKWAARQKERE